MSKTSSTLLPLDAIDWILAYLKSKICNTINGNDNVIGISTYSDNRSSHKKPYTGIPAYAERKMRGKGVVDVLTVYEIKMVLQELDRHLNDSIFSYARLPSQMAKEKWLHTLISTFYTDSYCTQLYPKTAPIWKAIQTSRGNIQNGTTQHIQNGACPPPPHEINPTNTSTASYAQAHARARAHALGHAIGNNSITQANSNTTQTVHKPRKPASKQQRMDSYTVAASTANANSRKNGTNSKPGKRKVGSNPIQTNNTMNFLPSLSSYAYASMDTAASTSTSTSTNTARLPMHCTPHYNNHRPPPHPPPPWLTLNGFANQHNNTNTNNNNNNNEATSKTNENCSSQTTNKKIKKEDDDDVRPKNFHENLYLNELRIMGFTNVREALGGIRYAMGYVSVGGPVAEAAMIWIVGQREAAAEARDLDLARISSEISREEELIAQNRDRRLKENITLANASTELILMPSYSTGQSKDGSSRNKGNVFFPSSIVLRTETSRYYLTKICLHTPEGKTAVIRYLNIEMKALKWYGLATVFCYFQYESLSKLLSSKDNHEESTTNTQKSASSCTTTTKKTSNKEDFLLLQISKENEALERALYSLSEQDMNVPRIFLEARRNAKLKNLPLDPPWIGGHGGKCKDETKTKSFENNKEESDDVIVVEVDDPTSSSKHGKRDNALKTEIIEIL